MNAKTIVKCGTTEKCYYKTSEGFCKWQQLKKKTDRDCLDQKDFTENSEEKTCVVCKKPIFTGETVRRIEVHSLCNIDEKLSEAEQEIQNLKVFNKRVRESRDKYQNEAISYSNRMIAASQILNELAKFIKDLNDAIDKKTDYKVPTANEISVILMDYYRRLRLALEGEIKK